MSAMSGFISLTHETGEPVYVQVSQIIAFISLDGVSRIYTQPDCHLRVQESLQEITDAISRTP